MIFNSFGFIVFFLVFIFLLYLAKTKQSKYILITVASLFFYGYWNTSYIYLILLSGSIDFFAGLLIFHNQKFKKIFLGISLVLNLGVLFLFKYLTSIAEFFEFDVNLHFTILPIGISFYTFQSMSYTIDIYRGEITPAKNFFKFFTYLSMFPQLVAGPIVRAKDVMDQLSNIKLQRGDELFFSLRLIAYGYFKKTVVADGVARYVNVAFANPVHNNSSLYWWIVATCFAIQIYCDFSGYSDIAIGLARMLGIKIPLNFNDPYRAVSFQDFWNRWHISLSSWFKDYLYFPLGGNRKGVLRSYGNLWMTMIVSGIWHGANMTFLVWGGLHALFLTFERLFKCYSVKAPTMVKRIIVLKLILISWIYFRSESLSQAHHILLTMLKYSGRQIPIDYRVFTILFLFILKECLSCFEFNFLNLKENRSCLWPVWIGIVAALSIFLRGEGNEFIYFQF